MISGPRRVERILLYVVLVAGAVIMLTPLSWMILTSLKSFSEVLTEPTRWLPAAPQWSNYLVALREFEFDKFFFNSVFVTSMTIAGTLVSCLLASYAFVFLEARGKGLLFALLLSTMMLPGQVTVIPLFKFFVKLGWINTYYPLILPAWLGANVFGIFLLRQFFLTIPTSYIEAARMDGASELRILWSVIVPLSKPVLMTITVFTFLGSWNDLFGPLIYLHDERLYTMPVGLLYFIAQAGALTQGGNQGTPWHLVMALTTVMILPIIVVFFVAQKRFVEGITSAGVKG